MKSVRYEIVFDGDWERAKMRGERQQCCDCGLIHIIDYRIVRNGKRAEVEVRSRRDDKATARLRKRAGISISKMS